jgi:hypothetical protein
MKITPTTKAPRKRGFHSKSLLFFRRVPVPGPVWFNVEPLGDSLIRELPDGLVGDVGVAIPAPGLACPVVAPGGLPDGGVAPIDPGVDVPAPAVPPGPAACAKVIELPSASAPANAIVANFMGRSLGYDVVTTRDEPPVFPSH